MKLLFYQGTPVPHRRHLHPHLVDTASELGWAEMQNGDLLAAAESAGYDALVTTDQNLRYQQNLTSRKIVIIVLRTTSWPRIRVKVDVVMEALIDLPPGSYIELEF